jgi:DHA2 family multidrug resistance protein-like MFS transporter
VNPVPPASAGRREWLGLAVLAWPTFLVSVDAFVLLLALPSISDDLDASSTEQLWIADSYGFLLAGFMITMGNIGDRIGRRRLLLIGAVAFGLASIAAAFAPTTEILVIARALLGIAGATLMPSTLSLIRTMFSDARQRGLAIGLWMVCFMAGATAGPLLGGLMLDAFWWGSVFLLGVPVMVLLLVFGPVLLPEYRNPTASAPVDVASVGLSLAAILLVVYGLKELAAHGWEPWPAVACAAGVALGAGFLVRQRRVDNPLLDLSLFRDRSFRGALTGMLLATMTTGAVLLFVSQFFQLVLGMTPFESTVWMIPAMTGAVAGNLVAPLLARRTRPAYVIGLGLATSVAGLVVLASTVSALATVVVGFTLVNLGIGPLAALATDLIVGSAPEEKAGSAASVSEVSGEFGYAIGVALLGSLGTLVYRSTVSVPEGTPPAVAASVGENLVAAVRASPGPALLDAARDAFTTGMQVVTGVSAGLLAVVACMTTWTLRDLPPIGSAGHGGQRDVEKLNEMVEQGRIAADPSRIGSGSRS